MNKEDLLQYLSNSILRQHTLERPLRVGIDGVDCAGKTTLANAMKPALEARGSNVVRASIDGFHLPRSKRYERGELSAEGYYHDSFDYASLRRYLLEPLGTPPYPSRCLLACFDFRNDAP